MGRLTNSDKEIPTLLNSAEYWLQVYFKLKEYEDLYEQGLLLRLSNEKESDINDGNDRNNTGTRKTN